MIGRAYRVAPRGRGGPVGDHSSDREVCVRVGLRLKLDEWNLEASSNLWSVDESGDEPVLQVTGHVEVEHIRDSQVALIDFAASDYSIEAEMSFIRNHLSDPDAGWFGFALRAQDFMNYEVVWFIPGAPRGFTVAYVPVAHGIVPWYTEAYETQKKGTVPLPRNDWFKARAHVKGDSFSIYVNDEFVFEKKLTYYLETGRPGFFVGTATDAKFRRVSVRPL